MYFIFINRGNRLVGTNFNQFECGELLLDNEDEIVIEVNRKQYVLNNSYNIKTFNSNVIFVPTEFINYRYEDYKNTIEQKDTLQITDEIQISTLEELEKAKEGLIVKNIMDISTEFLLTITKNIDYYIRKGKVTFYKRVIVDTMER